VEPVYDLIRHLAQVWVQKGILPDSFKYGFVVNALLCALCIGPSLGAVGILVLAKRMAFFSTAIGNAALTGIALGILAGEPASAPYISLCAFSLLFALVLNFARNKSGMPHDTLIGVFLAASIALGATLMMSVTRKISIHLLDSFLFGSLLSAGDSDITLLLAATAGAALFVFFFFNSLMLSGFAPALAAVRGVKVIILNYLFIMLLALVTVASVKIVGAVLVEALLIIPAAAARNVCRSLRSFLACSVIFATVSAVAGIILPLQLNWTVPSGGAIVLFATMLFVATLFARLLHIFRNE
jgi:zinc transport system permease protein